MEKIKKDLKPYFIASLSLLFFLFSQSAYCLRVPIDEKHNRFEGLLMQLHTKNIDLSSIDTVIFDVDGVILNTLPIFREATAYIYWKITNGISDDGTRLPSESELEEGRAFFDKTLGESTKNKIPKIIDIAKKRGIIPDRLNAADAYYTAYNTIRNKKVDELLKNNPQSLLLPGARELIAFLYEHNRNLYIASSTAEVDLRRSILKELGLIDYFKEVHIVPGLNEKMDAISGILARAGAKALFIDDAVLAINEAHSRFKDNLVVVGMPASIVDNEKMAGKAALCISGLDEFRSLLELHYKIAGGGETDTYERLTRSQKEKISKRDIVTHWEIRATRSGVNAVETTRYTLEENRSYTTELQRDIFEFLGGMIDGKNVFEIGVGIGRMTEELAKKSRRVEGNDISVVMLQRARDNLKEYNNVILHQGEITELDLPRKSFDLVFDTIVLLHILNPSDLSRTIEKMKELSDRILIVEHVYEGENFPSSKYTILRSQEEYIELFKPYKLIKKKLHLYGNDKLMMMLFENPRLSDLTINREDRNSI